MALARCSAETELETLHTARNHLFACGAACRGQEMAELRRQALASVIDSAPFVAESIKIRDSGGVHLVRVRPWRAFSLMRAI